MKRVRVKLKERSYDIFIGARSVKRLPILLKGMGLTGPWVIITDKKVLSKTAHLTELLFKRLPGDSFRIVVSSTERSKSLKTFQDTIHNISKRTKAYRPAIIAIGGGVVGDLAGFVAATYRRGVPFVQIPTTLLAQVDSSVGGKVGVDTREAKNLIGAFYQPNLVLMDSDFLKSLPRHEMQNGLAEVIKYGIIKDRVFFKFLEDNIENILCLKKNVLEKVIYKCAFIKARIVEKDELDTKDVRIALNLGHTLGHAIEAASGYSGHYNHGQSVALGMILAGEIAVQLNMLQERCLDRIKRLIIKAGLPVYIRGVAIKDIMNSCGYDKKFVVGSNRFVLPEGIGSIKVIDNVPISLIRAALKKYIR